MNRTLKTILKRACSLALSFSVALSAVPAVAFAEGASPADRTVFPGVSGISAPKSTENTATKWEGDYVYFGANSLRYRVLAPSTTVYSKDGDTETLFLDCDVTDSESETLRESIIVILASG